MTCQNCGRTIYLSASGKWTHRDSTRWGKLADYHDASPDYERAAERRAEQAMEDRAGGFED